MDNNSPARVAFDHGDRKLAAEIGRREHLGKILLNMVQERRGSPQARASAVGDLIRHGAPSNSLDVNGTALRWAAEYRDLALAQQLLKLGTRPEADIGPMRNHAHPLEVSVARQDLKMTRLLLEQRADPRFASSAFPPLFGAAYRGDEAMVRLLLEFGADPNQGVDVGEPDGKQHRWTPLTEARRGGHRPIERILRDAGGR
jgi:ankyrin repeat protein